MLKKASSGAYKAKLSVEVDLRGFGDLKSSFIVNQLISLILSERRVLEPRINILTWKELNVIFDRQMRWMSINAFHS